VQQSSRERPLLPTDVQQVTSFKNRT
jgi:hypothetical protein